MPSRRAYPPIGLTFHPELGSAQLPREFLGSVLRRFMGDQKVSATMTTTPAAGWYHDPSDSGTWRWWDGVSWTDHVRPVAEPAPVVMAVPPMQAISAPIPVVAEPALAFAPQLVPAPGEQVVAVPQPVVAPAPQYVAMPVSQSVMQRSPEPLEGPLGRGARPTAPRPIFNAQVLWPAVGSPQTVGVWLLALLPLLSIALYVGVNVGVAMVQTATGVIVPYPPILFLIILLGSAWIFAAADVAALRRHGYQPPTIGWMVLLPPLGYFIARGKAVRREGKRAWPPELLYFLSIFGITGLSVAYYLLLAPSMGGVDGLIALGSSLL